MVNFLWAAAAFEELVRIMVNGCPPAVIICLSIGGMDGNGNSMTLWEKMECHPQTLGAAAASFLADKANAMTRTNLGSLMSDKDTHTDWSNSILLLLPTILIPFPISSSYFGRAIVFQLPTKKGGNEQRHLLFLLPAYHKNEL